MSNSVQHCQTIKFSKPVKNTNKVEKHRYTTGRHPPLWSNVRKLTTYKSKGIIAEGGIKNTNWACSAGNKSSAQMKNSDYQVHHCSRHKFSIPGQIMNRDVSEEVVIRGDISTPKTPLINNFQYNGQTSNNNKNYYFHKPSQFNY